MSETRVVRAQRNYFESDPTGMLDLDRKHKELISEVIEHTVTTWYETHADQR